MYGQKAIPARSGSHENGVFDEYTVSVPSVVPDRPVSGRASRLLMWCCRAARVKAGPRCSVQTCGHPKRPPSLPRVHLLLADARS